VLLIKKKLPYLREYAFAIFLILYSSYSSAAGSTSGCSSLTYASDTSSFGSVVVQRDMPPGSVIQTIYTGYDGLWAANCTGYYKLGYTLVYSNTLSALGSHIYETNVPGIGIRVANDSDETMTFDSPVSTYDHYGDGIGWYGAKVELIVTGKVISGVLPAGPLATMAVTMIRDGQLEVGYTMKISSTNVTALSCSMKNGGALSFPIGDVSADEFEGQGTVSKKTSSVQLSLSCDADANVNITLNGTQNPDASDRSILALSGQGQANVAEGVGVQLLYDNTPLELNKLLNLRQSYGGKENFPITARYIQTKDNVKAGMANATATLNLTYQ